jgi:hypothetical protein
MLQSRIRILEDYNGQHAAILHLEKEIGYLTSLSTQKDQEIMVLRNSQSQLNDLNGAQHQEILRLQEGLKALAEQAAQKESKSLSELKTLGDIQSTQCEVILGLQEEHRFLKQQAIEKDHEIMALRDCQSRLIDSYGAQCKEVLRLQEETTSLREDATRKKREIAELRSKSMGQLDQSPKDHKITLYQMWLKASLPEDRATCESCDDGAKAPLLPCFRRLCTTCGPCECGTCIFARS